VQLLVNDAEITSPNVRAIPTQTPTEGVGTVEAPRGTLTHHYWTDENGVITRVNLIVGTTNNYGPIAMSVDKAARSLISQGTVVTDGLLDRIEMGFRAYDPCFGCATHTMPGQMPMVVPSETRTATPSRSCAVTDAFGPGEAYGLRLAEPGDTLVVGLGNPILGDDGVGWRVIDELDGLEHADASLQQACVGGVSLMELLVGYRRAIIVDAIIDPQEPPGSVWCRPLSIVETRVASHLDSTHDASLPVAIEAGRALGADLPSDIEVVGIVIERGDVFGEQLSDTIAAAVPVAAAAVVGALRQPRPSSPQGEPVHA
jgi:hydrogenase maturation protease